MDTALDELERAVYVNPTIENMRAYIVALEAYVEDLGDVQKELDSARSQISEFEDELDKAADKIIEYENRLGID